MIATGDGDAFRFSIGKSARRNADADSRAALKRYAEAIALWNARFDTAEIADRLSLPEPLVARWVANFREMVRA